MARLMIGGFVLVTNRELCRVCITRLATIGGLCDVCRPPWHTDAPTWHTTTKGNTP